jgi:hypothetical protein
LNAQDVFAGTDERLDLEVLFESLEEELDFAATVENTGGPRRKTPMTPSITDIPENV